MSENKKTGLVARTSAKKPQKMKPKKMPSSSRWDWWKWKLGLLFAGFITVAGLDRAGAYEWLESYLPGSIRPYGRLFIKYLQGWGSYFAGAIYERWYPEPSASSWLDSLSNLVLPWRWFDSEWEDWLADKTFFQNQAYWFVPTIIGFMVVSGVVFCKYLYNRYWVGCETDYKDECKIEGECTDCETDSDSGSDDEAPRRESGNCVDIGHGVRICPLNKEARVLVNSKNALKASSASLPNDNSTPPQPSADNSRGKGVFNSLFS